MGGCWGGGGEDLLGLFTHSESGLTPEAQPAGQGPAPLSPPLGATPGNMAKFALNQNLPGKCAKWTLHVYRSTLGTQMQTQPCSSLLCRVARGPFIKVDSIMA